MILHDPSGMGGNGGKATEEKSYVVKKGDTLGEIAKANGKSVEELKTLNGIENIHDIKVGQKLNLGASAATKAKPTSNTQQQNLEGLKLYIAKPIEKKQDDYILANQQKAEMLAKMSIPPPTESTGEISARVNKDNALEIVQDGKVVKTFAPNENGMVELPHDGSIETKTGTGSGSFSVGGQKLYNVYNYTGNDQWGKPKDVANLINAIIDYKKVYTNDLISIGDMRSPDNGKVAYSGGHHHGNAGAVDIRVLGEGGSYQGLFSDKRHDVDRSKLLIKLMGENGFSTAIVGRSIFDKLKSASDKNISVITDKPKKTIHENHYHFHL